MRRLLDTREVGLVDDPQAGGLAFLSDTLKPIVGDRNAYNPGSAEVAQLRSRILQTLFETPPTVKLGGEKTAKAGVQIGRASASIVGDNEEVQFRLEFTNSAAWEERRTTLLTETIGNPEWRTAIAWLIRPDEVVDDALVEALRSRRVLQKHAESEADRDVAQYLRSERRAAESKEDQARGLYRAALLGGTLIFRGTPTPASTAGATVEAAARKLFRTISSATILRSSGPSVTPLCEHTTYSEARPG